MTVSLMLRISSDCFCLHHCIVLEYLGPAAQATIFKEDAGENAKLGAAKEAQCRATSHSSSHGEGK